MSAVPQKVLNWLYHVLQGVCCLVHSIFCTDCSQEYYDAERTYSDVAQTLSHYPNLALRTNVYSTNP